MSKETPGHLRRKKTKGHGMKNASFSKTPLVLFNGENTLNSTCNIEISLKGDNKK